MGFLDSLSTEDSFCPSVMEMLDVIPQRIVVDGIDGFFEIGQQYDLLYFCQLQWHRVKIWIVYHDDFRTEWTLPNALAEMILWLHENKHISFNK